MGWAWRRAPAPDPPDGRSGRARSPFVRYRTITTWADSRHLLPLYTGQGMIPLLPMSNDLVELWKSNALQRVAEEQRSSAPASLRVGLSVGFVALATVVGVSWHSVGFMVVPAVLVTVLLVHELPRALIARLLARPSRIVLSDGGGSSTVSAAPLVGKAALGFALVGTFANLVVAIVALALLRSGLLPSAASVLRALAIAHAFWGISSGCFQCSRFELARCCNQRDCLRVHALRARAKPRLPFSPFSEPERSVNSKRHCCSFY